jgi:uroporphyrinogen III methyltransferase/synthase
MTSEGEGGTARVFLVGAGPGNPGLLTLRAAELLAAADVVLYDQLVPVRLLDFANPKAETICVRELPGKHPDKYPAIFELMIDRARRGQTVVRLKGGDPLIFGRGGEESDALRAAGIGYEIVPGVTAALGAAAFLDLPLTHRLHASAVAFVTGHELPSKPGQSLDWKALAAFPGTLVIYMGVSRLPLIVAELLKFGRSPGEPSLLVERASTGEMRSVRAPLAELDAARRHAGLEAPGLIMIGPTVALRREPSWFEAKPLFGIRVLVTRPRHQAREFMNLLESLGAVPIVLPALRIADPADPAAIDAAIGRLDDGMYDWIAFTSANAVHGFKKRLNALGRDVRVIGRTRIASVGTKTTLALKALSLTPDLEPEHFSGRALAEALAQVAPGQRILVPQANVGKATIASRLSGIATVDVVAAYDQIEAVERSHDAFAALARGEVQMITLTSANIARAVLGACDPIVRARIDRGEIAVVCLGPDVASAVRELGIIVAGIAEPSTDEGMIDVMKRLRPIDSRCLHEGFAFVHGSD